MSRHRIVGRVARGVLTGWVLALSVVQAHAQTQDDLFDDTRMHEVRLRVNQRDWAAMKDRSDLDTYYPADFSWDGVTVRNVGIRHRGFGSRSSAKPNIRVDMNRYISGQDFLGLKAVVLDNLYSDAAMMRDAVATKVFGRMGVPAARQAHTRLFVNDQFAGVYTLVEPIDRTFITRAFGEAEGDAERGGVLHEYRWLDEYFYDYRGPLLATYAQMFKAQTRDTDAMSRLYAPVEELIRTVNAVPAERFATDVGRLLDLPALMRFIGVQNCVGERDGFVGYYGTNNFYLYRFRDGRPAVLLPWDADNALSLADIPLDYQHASSVLVRRALAVPDLRRQYLLAVSECAAILAAPAAGDPRGWLEREVARLASTIAPDVARDTFALFDPDEFEAEVAQLLALARSRPSYLRCQVATATDRSLVAGGCKSP